MRRVLLLLAVATIAPQSAHAAPCADLPDPVYAQVGDTQENLMKRLGRALRDNAPRPLTLVYVTSGSCTNIEQIYERIPLVAGTTMKYIPSLLEDPTWTPESPTRTCEAPATVPDIGNSALFNTACTPQLPPATVTLAPGPTQAYVLAVPEASEETAITFEEAYFVFGFGQAGQIVPWTDETQFFIRTVTKSTLLAWAANIAVPAAVWKGTRFDGSPEVVNALTSSTAPARAIGILGAEVYDALRDRLDILAFRARGQYAAYYPDSTVTSRDKRNVRDGHYTVWSPTIWMETVDDSGAPVNPGAHYAIELITGKPATPAPAFDMQAIIASVGLVPDCAMHVKRSFEGGPLSLYQPAEDCTCRYESLVDTTSCATCSAAAPCTSGVCRDGYCEAR